MPKPIRFDFALKIAHYLQIYFRLPRSAALDFAFHQEREALTECRFGGTISGKFWCASDRWYVVSYLDAPSHNQEVLIQLVNVKLAALKARYEAGKLAWPTERDLDALRNRCWQEHLGAISPAA